MNKKRNQVLEYETKVWGMAVSETIKLYKTDWRAWFINLISIALTLIFLRILGGTQAFSDQWLALISGLIGAAGGSLFYLLVCRMSAPLTLYLEKEAELDKYGWGHVEFAEKEFHVPGVDGWGIEFANEKQIPLNIGAFLTKIRDGQNVEQIEMNKERIGYVAKGSDDIVDTSAIVPSGGKIIFVITGCQNNTPIPLFMSMGRKQSLHNIDSIITTRSDYIVSISLRCEAELNQELPLKTIDVIINYNGSILIRKN